MPYFIIIHGPLGSGKSTNAEKLAKTLKAERVALDQVLSDNNLDQLEPNSACIPAINFIKALDLIIPSTKQSLENGQIVIFDGCFYHQEVLEHLTQNLNFPHYIFTLKVPIDICIERDRLREKTLGEDAARAVHNLVSGHDFGVLIDADTSLEETHKVILSHLP
jgi:thymidylate kinase